MKLRGVRSILKNSAYLAALHSINSAARAVYAAVLAIYLGPVAYGIFNYGTAWYLAFLPLAFFGIDIYLSRTVSKSPFKAMAIVSNSFLLRLILTLGTALISILSAWYFEADPATRMLILIFSVALVGRSLAVWVTSVATAYERVQITFKAETIARLLEVSVGLTLALLGTNIIVLAVIHALSWWGQAVTGMVLLRRNVIKFHAAWQPGIQRILLLRGWPLALGAFLISWMLQGTLIVFRNAGGSGHELGQLALTMQAFIFLAGLPTVLANAALPVLIRTVAREDGKERFFLEVILRVSFLLGTALAILAHILGPIIVAALFGDRFREAGQLLGPILWLVIPFSASGVMWQVQLAHDKISTALFALAAGGLCLAISVAILTPKMGALGAIIGAGAGLLLWMFLMIIISYSTAKINVRVSVFIPLLAILCAASIFFYFSPSYPVAATAVSLLLMLGLFAMLGGVTKEEYSMLKRIFRRTDTS